jgi:hypothetical protein
VAFSERKQQHTVAQRHHFILGMPRRRPGLSVMKIKGLKKQATVEKGPSLDILADVTGLHRSGGISS